MPINIEQGPTWYKIQKKHKILTFEILEPTNLFEKIDTLYVIFSV